MSLILILIFIGGIVLVGLGLAQKNNRLKIAGYVVLGIGLLGTIALGFALGGMDEENVPDKGPTVSNDPSIDTEREDPCSTAQRPSGRFASIAVPDGWKVYTNEGVGFQFAYPPGIFISSETHMTDFTNDGSCVYAADLHLTGKGWEAYWRATRGEYATGREGFDGTRQVDFMTVAGTRGQISIDSLCGNDQEPEWGPDCGHDAYFDENGISFLLGTFAADYDQENFDLIPRFENVFATLQTLPL